MTFPAAPLKLDKPLRRGAELRIRHTVLTASGAPQDIAGAVFTANVRSGEGKDTTIIFALTQTVVSNPAGVIDFSLTPAQTLALVSGIDHWISVWVNHATWTGGIDRLELHGRLDLIG